MEVDMKWIVKIIIALIILLSGCSEMITFDVFIEYPFDENETAEYEIDPGVTLNALNEFLEENYYISLDELLSLNTIPEDLEMIHAKDDELGIYLEITKKEGENDFSFSGILDKSSLTINLREENDIKDYISETDKILAASLVSLSATLTAENESDLDSIMNAKLYLKPGEDDGTLFDAEAADGSLNYFIGVITKDETIEDERVWIFIESYESQKKVNEALKNLHFTFGVETFFHADSKDFLPKGIITGSLELEAYMAIEPLK
jgi:hypothetical protein